LHGVVSPRLEDIGAGSVDVPERSQIFRGSYREVQVVFQGDE
jgi:hypothetical protein